MGKSKNWGSRSGKNTPTKEKKAKYLLTESSIPTEILKKIVNAEKDLITEARSLLEMRSSFFKPNTGIKKVFSNRYGKLYQGDCLNLLNKIEDESVDCIFADPPFNLSKRYDNNHNDNLSKTEYLEWSYTWLEGCISKLKQGGALYVYNIPRWAIYYSNFLNKFLTFRTWIAVDMTFSMPIPNRLYPSHYALLYYIKGKKPSRFTPPRTPIKTCVRCGKEQNDYGGYKKKMNPNGVNIRDVWTDIPPVRHSKYKTRDANELSIKLIDRILDISTHEKDLVFDPFGGSGTTYVVSQLKKRRWIGCELGDPKPIIDRLYNLEEEREKLFRFHKDTNTLFTDKAIELRAKHKLPLDNYNISQNQIQRVLGDSFQNELPL